MVSQEAGLYSMLHTSKGMKIWTGWDKGFPTSARKPLPGGFRSQHEILHLKKLSSRTERESKESTLSWETGIRSRCVRVKKEKPQQLPAKQKRVRTQSSDSFIHLLQLHHTKGHRRGTRASHSWHWDGKAWETRYQFISGLTFRDHTHSL